VSAAASLTVLTAAPVCGCESEASVGGALLLPAAAMDVSSRAIATAVGADEPEALAVTAVAAAGEAAVRAAG